MSERKDRVPNLEGPGTTSSMAMQLWFWTAKVDTNACQGSNLLLTWHLAVQRAVRLWPR